MISLEGHVFRRVTPKTSGFICSEGEILQRALAVKLGVRTRSRRKVCDCGRQSAQGLLVTWTEPLMLIMVVICCDSNLRKDRIEVGKIPLKHLWSYCSSVPSAGVSCHTSAGLASPGSSTKCWREGVKSCSFHMFSWHHQANIRPLSFCTSCSVTLQLKIEGCFCRNNPPLNS